MVMRKNKKNIFNILINGFKFSLSVTRLFTIGALGLSFIFSDMYIVKNKISIENIINK